MAYTIWLEFEQYDPPVMEETDGYCNMIVTYDDGRTEGYNVWTTDCVREQLPDILSLAEYDGYALLPDLIVTRITREHIIRSLRKLVGDPLRASS